MTEARGKFNEEWDYFIDGLNLISSAMNSRRKEFLQNIQAHLDSIELDFKNEICK